MIVTLRGLISRVELEPLLGRSTAKSRHDACAKSCTTKWKSCTSALLSAVETHVTHQQCRCTPTNLGSQNCQDPAFAVEANALSQRFFGSCRICQTLASCAHRKMAADRQDCAETHGVSQQKRNGNINDFHSLLFT